MSLIGSRFVRREAQGDDGDVVVLKGAMAEAQIGGGHRDLVVIAAAEHGAVPAAWDSHSVTLTPDDLVEEYRPETAAEAAVGRLAAAADAKAATDALEADENRISPWAYVLPAKRRTGRGTRS